MLAKKAGLISLATLLSRVLGLVREQVFALLVGASHAADAFQVGFRLPNLLRDLFAEGALSQSFVPVFRRVLDEKGDEAAHRLADRVTGALVMAMLLATGAGLVVAPFLVPELAAGFERVPGKVDLAVTCTRIMLPFLPIVAAASVAMGMLNARERFGAPSLASASFNVVAIVAAAILWAAGFERRDVAIGWAGATVLGGLAQLAIQVPPLRKTGYRFRPTLAGVWRDPDTRRVFTLLLPSVIGLAGTQVNLFVNTWFATSEPSAVSWLSYAFRFLQLPIGLFGVAIGVVSATRFADAAARRDDTRMADQMEESLRLLAFLTIPATVGLFVLSQPIVRLIYQRGAFALGDTISTAAALRAYTVGLCAYAAVKVLAPAFYARGSARLPMWGAIAAVAVNVAFALVAQPRWGFEALALGTSFGAIVNFAVLLVAFYAEAGAARLRALVWPVTKMIIASGLVYAVALLTHQLLDGPIHTYLATFVAMVAGGVAYAAATLGLRVAEAQAFWRKLTRRARGPR